MAHDIGYTGPSDKYTPPIGLNDPDSGVPTTNYNIIGGYADTNYLNQILTNLINTATAAQNDMVAALQNVALTVTTDPADTKLNQANEILWPSNLGTPPNYITYRYYSSLSVVNSAAATYVRNAYEKACRGVTGTNAIDLLPIVQICLNEADLIQEFTSKYATQLSDSSQRRTVELLQDWVETATQHISNIQTIFAQGGTVQQLPTSALGTLSPQDASNSQAIFQVNVNQLNANLAQSLGTLQKNFADYASTFYSNFLGPAVGFRNTVTTNIIPEVMPQALSQHLSPASTALNNNLQNVLADQLRRNQVFDIQVQNTLVNIQLRDTYRSYIQQLSTAGTSIPSGSTGTVINVTDTPAAAAYFDSTITASPATPNYFLSPHSELSGLNDPLAHYQYLLKDGDNIKGNLTMDTGVLIDGMRPSTHIHNGLDGTQQIHGSDIIPGSLSSGSIDTSQPPAVPLDLAIVSQTVYSVPPGVSLVDLVIGWEGDPTLVYEVQIVKADS